MAAAAGCHLQERCWWKPNTCPELQPERLAGTEGPGIGGVTAPG